jgi:hypothetical protein
MFDETEHDLAQPRVRRAGEALQHLGRDIVFGFIALHHHL